MTTYQTGLLLRGLSYASSANPTLFVTGDLDPSTISGLSPLSSSTQIVGRLVGVSGFAISSSIREPVGVGSEVTATLQEDAEGTLAQLFAQDPAFSATTLWTLDTVSTLSASATTLVLTGPTAPTAGQVIYLGQEAIRISTTGADTTTSGHVHTCANVTRGACGSHAKTHQIRPSGYVGGDDGRHATLTASSRPLWDDVLYEAAVYQWAMSDSDPAACSACEFVWFGHVTTRPEWDAEHFQWKLKIAHVSRAIREWTFSGGKDLEIKNCVIVMQEEQKQIFGPIYSSAKLPRAVVFPLTRLEFEKLFDVPVHNPHSPNVIESLIDDVNDKLHQNPRVAWEIYLEAGGHKWSYRIDEAYWPGGDLNAAYVSATLAASEPGAFLNDSPVSYQNPLRDDGYNEGFSRLGGNGGIVRTDQGESAPKLTLRARMRLTFPAAAQVLLLSGHGGGVNHSSYDILLNGPQLDPEWVNTGSIPGSALSVDEGTTEWLGLKALLSETYDYALVGGQTKGIDWFNNELRLHCCLMSFVPSTGKIAARIWARKRGSVTALNPIVEANATPADISERLTPIRALILERGIFPVTLEPRFRKPIQMPEAQARDVSDAITIRIWKDGGAITDAELEAGPLARLERAFFGTTRGRPPVWPVPLAISAGFTFADFSTWTEPSVPTPTGIGVTALPVIVVGLDRDMESGRLIARVMHDVFNVAASATASAGRVAPALKIVAVASLNGSNQFRLVLEAVGDRSFNIVTSAGGIFQTIAAASGRVRLVSPTKHNSTEATDRTGLAECSAVLTSVTRDGRTNLAEVTINAAWQRGSLVYSDFARVGNYLLLQDYRTSGTNPEATTIQGHADQDYNAGSGRDFIKYSLPSTKPTRDGRKSLIGS